MVSPEEAVAVAVIGVTSIGAILAAVVLALFTDAGPQPYCCILVILLGTPFALRMVDDDAE
jgi:hypothetical protein